MEKYCTVSVKPNTKEVLKNLKEKTGESYDTIIQEMLGENIGYNYEVEKFERNQEAIRLKYVEIGNAENYNEKIVTYSMLKTDPIGTRYVGESNPNRDGEYLNGVCEIIYRFKDNVVVAILDVHYKNGEYNTNFSVLHFNVF